MRCAMAGGREPLSRAPRDIDELRQMLPAAQHEVAAAEEGVMLAVVKTATMVRSWRYIGARDALSDALIVRVKKTCTQASAGRACRTAIKRRARGSRCWQAPGRHVRCSCASLRELNRLSLSCAPQPDISNTSSTSPAPRQTPHTHHRPHLKQSLPSLPLPLRPHQLSHTAVTFVPTAPPNLQRRAVHTPAATCPCPLFRSTSAPLRIQ